MLTVVRSVRCAAGTPARKYQLINSAWCVVLVAAVVWSVCMSLVTDSPSRLVVQGIVVVVGVAVATWGVGPDPRLVDTLTPAVSWGRKVVFHHAKEDLHGAVQA